METFTKKQFNDALKLLNNLRDGLGDEKITPKKGKGDKKTTEICEKHNKRIDEIIVFLGSVVDHAIEDNAPNLSWFYTDGARYK